MKKVLDKVKGFIESKKGEAIILVASVIFHLFFTLIAYSIEFVGRYRGGNIWTSASIYKNRPMVNYFSVAFIGLFILGLVLFLLIELIYFFKKKRKPFYVLFPYNIAVSLFILFVHMRYKMLSGGSIACFVFAILFSVAGFVYLIHRRVVSEEIVEKERQKEKEEKVVVEVPKNVKLYKRILFAFEWVSLVVLTLIFAIPLYSNKVDFRGTSYYLSSAISSSAPLAIYILFIVFFLMFLLSLLYMIST
ncbi:MAG: hypothetical protein K2J93_00350, partial [Anaeroplasmataceae bacterium]|nr:hypothetical protein [Anaeroplasmataceae bacterium]